MNISHARLPEFIVVDLDKILLTGEEKLASAGS
jgi:hypothetical protein